MLAQHGVVSNKKKFRFCRQSVEFAGFTITPKGIEPSPKILAAIKNFPPPTNLTNAQSWFGLVGQLSWAYSMSPIMQPFRDLIKSDSKFSWTDQLKVIFQKSKSQIIQCVQDGVRMYDCKLPTCLQTDWSKEGIGYSSSKALFLHHDQCTTMLSRWLETHLFRLPCHPTK